MLLFSTNVYKAENIVLLTMVAKLHELTYFTNYPKYIYCKDVNKKAVEHNIFLTRFDPAKQHVTTAINIKRH